MLGWRRRRRDGDDQTETAAQPSAEPPPPLFPVYRPEAHIRAADPVVWVPDTDPPQVTLAELASLAPPPIELCPAASYDLPSSLWFSNHANINPDHARQLMDNDYASRTAHVASIRLVALPVDTVVFGGGHFLTACGDRFLSEQFPPYATRDYRRIDALAPLDLAVIEIEREVLLVARYGVGSWSQWITELLPKIVLVEQVFPDRFAFLLPAAIVQAEPGSIWSAVRETLQSCGVDTNRVFAAAIDTTYRFSALHAVTPLWSDRLMHPSAAEALRTIGADVPASIRRRVAILSDAPGDPVLANAEEIGTMLQLRGFAPVHLRELPFVQQIATLKGASTLFMVAGSDLGNLVFGPPGLRLITAAPEPSNDRRGYALVLDRQGRMADLRGSVVDDSDPANHGAFVLDPMSLLTALNTMPA